jgi:hypothetical protein
LKVVENIGGPKGITALADKFVPLNIFPTDLKKNILKKDLIFEDINDEDFEPID